MHAHVCTHTHACSANHILAYTRTHLSTHTRTFTRTHTRTLEHTHIHTSTHTHTSTQVPVLAHHAPSAPLSLSCLCSLLLHLPYIFKGKRTHSDPATHTADANKAAAAPPPPEPGSAVAAEQLAERPDEQAVLDSEHGHKLMRFLVSLLAQVRGGVAKLYYFLQLA